MSACGARQTGAGPGPQDESRSELLRVGQGCLGRQPRSAADAVDVHPTGAKPTSRAAGISSVPDLVVAQCAGDPLHADREQPLALVAARSAGIAIDAAGRELLEGSEPRRQRLPAIASV